MDSALKDAVIYGLYDRAGALRYIGKASCPAKRLKSHMQDSKRRRTPLYSWIRKHGQPEMRVLEVCGSNWREVEKRLIAEARERGEPLLNVADGGDEPHCPKEVRAQNGRSAAKKRDPFVWRFNRDFAQALKEGWLSEATKELLRELASLRPKEFGRWANI